MKSFLVNHSVKIVSLVLSVGLLGSLPGRAATPFNCTIRDPANGELSYVRSVVDNGRQTVLIEKKGAETMILIVEAERKNALRDTVWEGNVTAPQRLMRMGLRFTMVIPRTLPNPGSFYLVTAGGEKSPKMALNCQRAEP